MKKIFAAATMMFILTALVGSAGADVKIVAVDGDGSNWTSWGVEAVVDYGATVVLRQSRDECWPPGRATVTSEQYRGICSRLGVHSLSRRTIEWCLDDCHLFDGAGLEKAIALALENKARMRLSPVERQRGTRGFRPYDLIRMSRIRGPKGPQGKKGPQGAEGPRGVGDMEGAGSASGSSSSGCAGCPAVPHILVTPAAPMPPKVIRFSLTFDAEGNYHLNIDTP